MSEAVKMPHINLSYDCDASIIGELIEFLKSKYQSINITVSPIQDDDEEMVDAFESDFWKNSTVGNLLAGYRLKHGLTQKQLAERAGMSHATISDYENSKKNMSRRSAIKLATALGEDSDCFLKILPGNN